MWRALPLAAAALASACTMSTDGIGESEEALSWASPGAPVGGGVPVTPTIPLLEQIVGVAFTETGEVVAWQAGNVVSAGVPTNFAIYRAPERYEPGPSQSGLDIIGTAVDASGRVLTWYDNMTYSIGDRRNLGSQMGWAPFSLPPGYTPSDVVGIAMSKTTNRVFVWYDDGRRSYGTAHDLDRYGAPASFSVDGEHTASQIVGMAMAPDGRTHTWFSDGELIVGQTRNLDYYEAPRLYTRHGILHDHWESTLPPSTTLVPHPPTISPASRTVGSKPADMMIAAGPRFVAVSGNASVRFYDRDMNPYPVTQASGLAVPTSSLPLAGPDGLFAPFMRDAPSPAARTNDVNHYLNFHESCSDPDNDYYVNSGHYRLCVSNGAYDTRVLWDDVGERFVIVAHLRNSLWENADVNWNDESERERCAVSRGAGASNGSHPDAQVHDRDDCRMTARIKAIAVSRTDDPRDGFETYVVANPVSGDSPWATINGDWLLLNTFGYTDTIFDWVDEHPAVFMLSLEDLRAGDDRPEWIDYMPDALGGVRRMEAPLQHGEWPDRSLFVGTQGGTQWTLAAIEHPTLPYERGAVRRAIFTGPDARWSNAERSVFRDGALHMASMQQYAGTAGNYRTVRYDRFPVAMWRGLLRVQDDPLGGAIRYELTPPDGSGDQWLTSPHVQVNARGDVLVQYADNVGLLGPATSSATTARYFLWPAGAATANPPQLFQSTPGMSARAPTMALAGSVDPLVSSAFWTIGHYTGGHAFGSVIP